MKLLLDQGLPRSAVFHLEKQGIAAIHAGEVGLANAADGIILDYARRQACTIVTLDADFHALLALMGASTPSVIRVRIEGLRAEALATLLINVLKMCEKDLMQGAMVSVTGIAMRIRHLPLLG